MSNTGYKIGDRVKHTISGSLGQVIDIDPSRGIYVFWESGASVYYGGEFNPGESNPPLNRIKKA